LIRHANYEACRDESTAKAKAYPSLYNGMGALCEGRAMRQSNWCAGCLVSLLRRTIHRRQTEEDRGTSSPPRAGKRFLSFCLSL